MTTVSDQPVMAVLKESTAELHAHAESRGLQRAMMSGGIDRQTYVRFLRQLHAVHGALEGALRVQRDAGRSAHAAFGAVCKDEHQHTSAIEMDMRALSAGADTLDGTQLTEVALKFAGMIREWSEKEPVALLGCLYVLEGSMNGNRFLARSVGKALGVGQGPRTAGCSATAAGLGYLDPYGERQREVWQEFREAMNAQTFSDAEREQMLKAARATFGAFADISDAVIRE